MGEGKVFRFTVDSFYSSTDQPCMTSEASNGLWVTGVLGTVQIEAWLPLSRNSLWVICGFGCVMFIVRSILVLDLWLSSFILYGSLTLYCKLRLLK